MSENPFAFAKAGAPEPNRQVLPEQPFFHAAIEQDKRRKQAANMTRQEMFDNGFISVTDLDDEELRYGRCRDGHGRIPRVTNKTELVPRDLYDEMVAEHEKRFQEKLRQQLDTALNTMVECMTDTTAEWRERSDAAKYLMERVIGKPREKVDVTVRREPWEDVMLTSVGQIKRAESRALREGSIDAEVVDVLPDSGLETSGPIVGETRPDGSVRVDSDPRSDPSGAKESHRAAMGVTKKAEDDIFRARPGQPYDHEILPATRESDQRSVQPEDESAPEMNFVPPEFEPHPEAPSWDLPAVSDGVTEAQLAEQHSKSEEIRRAQKAAEDLAAARKEARDRIAKAKSSRKAKRALGLDAVKVDLTGPQAKFKQAMEGEANADEA